MGMCVPYILNVGIYELLSKITWVLYRPYSGGLLSGGLLRGALLSAGLLHHAGRHRDRVAPERAPWSTSPTPKMAANQR